MQRLNLIYWHTTSVSNTLLIPRHQRILLILRQSKIRHASSRVGRVRVARVGILIEVIEVIQEF